MVRPIALIAAGAVVYVAAARLGFAVTFLDGTVSAVWPATGVARRSSRSAPPAVAGGPARRAHRQLGPWDAGRHRGGPRRRQRARGARRPGAAAARRIPAQLDRVRDVFALLIGAAALATVLSSTVGVAALAAGGRLGAGNLGEAWRVWWLGNATPGSRCAPTAPRRPPRSAPGPPTA